ncbi:MAG TPA: glycosyltransferase 87 family protein [Candidatus Bathyarchaeia archaeon]|nr:glycosyltransferase 87 family protein [Candidatus Bathyarchaeia archaeon]
MIGALVAGTGLVAACAIMARIPSLVESPGLFLLLLVASFLCYGAGIWRLGARHGPRAMWVTGLVALAARLALLPATPTLSTDVYRYVWDARVAHAGISPYRFAPWAEELEPLRDAHVFPRLNHPTWRTIYPPGAQLFFQAVYRLRPDSVLAMKAALGLAELIAAAAVVGLLRASGRPASQLVIYAWNPLMLIEVWGMGHLEGLVLPAVVGAAWVALRGRYAPAGALLGLGALIKLYPAALLSLLPVAAWPTAGLAFLVVTLGGYAPAWISGTPVAGSLPRYVTEEYFNPGMLRSVLEAPALSLAAAALWVVIASVVRRNAALPARAVLLIGGLTLLSPNIFPWYVVWLVPFLAVAPSAPWIAFTGSVMFAYAFFLERPWAVPSWARLVEFAPLAIGAVWWLWRRAPVFRWEGRAA